MSMFLRNCWYVAAWNYEIADGLVARTILGEPVVLFRAPDGRPAALENRCCHRHLPLSQGRRVADGLECGYHGLVFDANGACIRVPGQTAVPPGASIKSYPVVEKWRWIWIWMGDPALADPDKVPDYHWNDDPEWTSYGDVYHVEGDYRLMVDNLVDLSHIQFLHVTSLGAGSDQDADIAVGRGDGTVTFSRWVMDVPPAPLYAKLLGEDCKVDRWQNITYTPPSHLVIDAGSAIAGTGAREGDRSQGVETYSNHTLTPETETTTHYFWHHARNFALDDEALTESMRGMFSAALQEDVVAIGAQQTAMLRAPDAPQIDINFDNAPIQARQLLAQRIAEEAAGAHGA
jgi:vanillate O-demethylase monooxygenase subunit